MRKRSDSGKFSVHAIAGAEVVLLGMNADEAATPDLLGFAIERYDHETKTSQGVPHGWDSYAKPIRAFLWGDYQADPNKTYTYTVTPISKRGSKKILGEPLKVKVRTENPAKGTHGVFFNRGVAGSQKYAELFGEHKRYYLDEKPLEEPPDPDSDEPVKPREVYAQAFIKPKDVPEGEAYKWLSRGLEEALVAFIRKAKNKNYSIRAAVYEFTYVPVIQEFVDALERGADVQIIHHAKRKGITRLKRRPRIDEGEPEYAEVKTQAIWTPADGRKPRNSFNKSSAGYLASEVFRDDQASAAVQAVSQVGLRNWKHKDRFDQMMIERTDTTISHNKFIVLLKDGKPVEVWTGSTNFTEGGIFGQSNVGHVVRDSKVAKRYHAYWKKLSTDPKRKSAAGDPDDAGIRNWTVKQQPNPPSKPKRGITTVFSPRTPKQDSETDILDWYADRLNAGTASAFFTAAFSVSQSFMDVLTAEKDTGDSPYLRYLMLEGTGGPLKDKFPLLEECQQNRIAWGDRFKNSSEVDDDAVIETLSGLNSHVNYVHTKYMLVDALSDDPLVITGSANFSKNSTELNDENMLIIRGDTRVADIYLGEFMRLFNHFRSRNLANQESRTGVAPPEHDPWTAPYYDSESQEFQERMLFA